MADYIGIYPVTKEELDKVKAGDYIRVNNWSRGMKVRVASDNYIICATKSFDGQFIYSVISKRPATFTHNNIKESLCYCGKDNMIFGDSDFDYNFDDDAKCKQYIQKFETGELEISHKRSEAVYRIAWKAEDSGTEKI